MKFQRISVQANKQVKIGVEAKVRESLSIKNNVPVKVVKSEMIYGRTQTGKAVFCGSNFKTSTLYNC